jgi:7tm Odorant receptor
MIISIEQLEELLLDKASNDGSQYVDQDILEKMKIIIDGHVDLTKFMSTFNKVFSLIYLVEFLTIIPQVAALLTRISMNLLTLNEYFSLMMCLFGVFSSCLLGSSLEVQHGKYFTALCELQWIKLPIREQKLLQTMLQASMKNIYLQCGIWDYDLKMFVSLCQSAYSYFNIMLRLRE